MDQKKHALWTLIGLAGRLVIAGWLAIVVVFAATSLGATTTGGDTMDAASPHLNPCVLSAHAVNAVIGIDGGLTASYYRLGGECDYETRNGWTVFQVRVDGPLSDGDMFDILPGTTYHALITNNDYVTTALIGCSCGTGQWPTYDTSLVINGQALDLTYTQNWPTQSQAEDLDKALIRALS